MEHFRVYTGEGVEAMAELASRRGSLSERTVLIAHEVLAGRHRSLRSYLAFAGPAVVACRCRIDRLHGPGKLRDQYASRSTAVVLLLNVILIVQTFGIPIPGLPAAD
jgi:hypothetical protein